MYKIFSSLVVFLQIIWIFRKKSISLHRRKDVLCKKPH